MAGEFDFPADTPVTDKNGTMPVPWGQWFSRAQAILLSVRQSGTTANRPVSVLWIGRRYFDTTIGKPVYLLSIGPNVWVDGAGVVS